MNNYAKNFFIRLDIKFFIPYNCNQVMVDNRKHIVTYQKLNGQEKPLASDRINFAFNTSLDILLLGITILIINLIILG